MRKRSVSVILLLAFIGNRDIADNADPAGIPAVRGFQFQDICGSAYSQRPALHALELSGFSQHDFIDKAVVGTEDQLDEGGVSDGGETAAETEEKVGTGNLKK